MLLERNGTMNSLNVCVAFANILNSYPPATEPSRRQECVVLLYTTRAVHQLDWVAFAAAMYCLKLGLGRATRSEFIPGYCNVVERRCPFKPGLACRNCHRVCAFKSVLFYVGAR